VSKYWFKPHRYGIGAYPSSWEGWLSIPAFAAVMVMAITTFQPDRRPFVFAFVETALVGMYVWLAWIKTDGEWRWRWGDDA
jgi:hypothetical protein